MARCPTYVGPKTQVQPESLHRYDATGLYAAEEKHDGFWAEVITNSSGRISSITGRSGKEFDGSHVAGLIGYELGIVNSTFIAELESGTQAAVNRMSRMGHKRLWVFDVVRLLGYDTREMAYEKRRELLEVSFRDPTLRVRLVKRKGSGFYRFFNEVSTEGGEGLILKRLGKPYRSQTSEGKTDEWVRCKKNRYVDYVAMSVGQTELGSPNMNVGLYFNGRLQHVATVKNMPSNIDPSRIVGKVVECVGAEVNESGSLRHGHFVRVRDDKHPMECTIEAARES